MIKTVYCIRLHVHSSEAYAIEDKHFLHTTNKKFLDDLCVKLNKKYKSDPDIDFFCRTCYN